MEALERPEVDLHLSPGQREVHLAGRREQRLVLRDAVDVVSGTFEEPNNCLQVARLRNSDFQLRILQSGMSPFE